MHIGYDEELNGNMLFTRAHSQYIIYFEILIRKLNPLISLQTKIDSEAEICSRSFKTSTYILQNILTVAVVIVFRFRGTIGHRHCFVNFGKEF